MPPYPERAAERNAWILSRRPPRNPLDPSRPWAFFVEEECAPSGEVVPVAAVFLTNRECPWRCLMCDLWRNTLDFDTPPGAVPEQIDYALRRLPPARHIKLYNSGSFFDRRAIPLQDHPAIAHRLASFDRVIVECHPALAGDDCLRFRYRLSSSLEVAMGLETAHPEILSRLNKGMTLDQFAAAAGRLRNAGIDLRVFILIKPPFLREASEAIEWSARSVTFAFNCGATAVSLIPTRASNGAMEALAASGGFSPPALATVEAAVEDALSLSRGRVFTDLWDISRIPECAACHEERIQRLRAMNLQQKILPRVLCTSCGGSR
jgi:archaeosine synthase beta-subunit